MNKNKLILSLIASNLFLISSFGLNNSVLAKEETNIDDSYLNNEAIQSLLNKIENTKKNKGSLEEEAKNLEYTIAELKEELSTLENKIDYFKEYLINKQFEIEELNYLLSDLVNESEKSKTYLEKHQTEFKEHLNVIYKQYNKNDSMLLEVLLNSDGFFDMINNLTLYKTIVKKDNNEVVDYMSMIESYEKSQKETRELLSNMENKIKEYDSLIANLNEVLLEKLKTEDNLTLALTSKKNEILKNDNDLVKLENRFELEREKVFEEFVAEKESKRLEEEKYKLKNTSNTNNNTNNTNNNSNTSNSTSNIANNLNFSGDSSFNEYQKSINWARNVYGIENIKKYYELIDKYSKEYGVPSWLIKGIIMTESGFNKDTSNVNSNGTIDRGLMQMNSNTAPGVANNVGIDYYVGIEFIPEYNIKMGTYYISAKIKENGSDYHKGLTSYNRGNAGAKRYYENNGTYESTYSKKVIGYGEVFKKEEGL